MVRAVRTEDSAEGALIATGFTIRYRRPEAPGSWGRMTVPNGDEVTAQKGRLEALGYSIVDVTPSVPLTIRSSPLR